MVGKIVLLLHSSVNLHGTGPGWGRFYIASLQFSVCFGAVIGTTLLGGQSMKSLYLVEKPGGTMKLYEFVIIFGVLMLVLAQIPSFHSLRHINLVSLLLCLAYSACATAGSIHADRVFGAFNAISIIATTYGNGIIPEIQATAAPPVTGKMFKGLCLCYAIVISTFFSVAISGYWAFGNQSQSIILSNFIQQDGSIMVPRWFFIMTNVFAIVQLTAVAVVYLQPTNEVLEMLISDPTKGQYSARNVVPRLFSRSLAMAIATLIATMIPFFGDINAVIGAFGFLPLDFVVPAVFYNLTITPSRRGVIFWLNSTIAIVFSLLSALGSVAAVRQIVLDSKNYKLFANL